MARFWVWLVGKKTYLLAGVLILATLVLVAMGKLTPQAVMSILLFAACGFPVTFRLALAAHEKQVLDMVVGVAETGAALAAHNYSAARVAATGVAADATELLPALFPAAVVVVAGPQGPAGPAGPQGPAGVSTPAEPNGGQ